MWCRPALFARLFTTDPTDLRSRSGSATHTQTCADRAGRAALLPVGNQPVCSLYTAQEMIRSGWLVLREDGRYEITPDGQRAAEVSEHALIQRDRRNERPRSHHRGRLRRPRRSRARLRLLLRLTGALDVPASSANIRDARGHQEAFARRHLVGSPNAKRPQPTMLSSQRGPTEDEDGRRDQTLLRPYGPVRVEVLLPVIRGVA